MKTRFSSLLFLCTLRIFAQETDQASGQTSGEIQKEKKQETHLMYLNAVDFDFSNSKSGYAGHLNIYKPAALTNSENKIGFNAGVMKINYSNSDSTMVHRIDTVKAHPLDQFQPGDTYARKYNQYKLKNAVTSLSLYFQILFAPDFLNSANKPTAASETKKADIMFHLHTELLVSKFTTATSIKTLQSDSLTVDNATVVPRRLFDLQLDNYSRTTNLINGYFGAGVTFDFDCFDNASLFFQPTIGYTTNYPQPASVNNSNSPILRVNNIQEWSSFYLIRSYFRYKLSDAAADEDDAEKNKEREKTKKTKTAKGSSEIIIGTDIRGLFPMYAPYYSVYVGLNVDIAKIADLFK